MTNYDLSSLLSPIDFEILSKDLLEAELKVSFENFREGKDKGIDLRYAPVTGEQIIVQCKKYKRDGFKSLFSVLKKEIIKVQKLNPNRYILSTSAALSPDQANRIKDLMNPYILTTGDIFGLDRLNELISSNDEVERRHIKLWASSTGVLESILHAGTHVVSREEIEKTIRAASLYVRNESFDEALSILKKQHVCIISGQPGIGKTTLARMLLLYFYKLDYEIIKIESDISEGRAQQHHNKPKLFLYDDFLGQTAHGDKLNKNEDQKLIDFMKSIHQSYNSIMILTTREYILNQARLTYEKMNREDFQHRTCILDLTKYSRKIRAQILYNHLHFSDLPQPFIDAIVNERGYIKIVDHSNYSPRLIEFLTLSSWLGNVSPKDYVALFVSKLDNPSDIWDHAFKNQLSDSARHLLIILVTLPYEIAHSDLKVAFDAFHTFQCVSYGIPRSANDFHRALKELDGTFISSRKIDGNLLFKYQNPSIRDYMKNVVFSGEYSGMHETFVFFEQPLWFIEAISEKTCCMDTQTVERLRDPLIDSMKSLISAASCSFSVTKYLNGIEHLEKAEIDYAFRLIAVLERLFEWRQNITGDMKFIDDTVSGISVELITGKQPWVPYVSVVKVLRERDIWSETLDQKLIQVVKRNASEASDIYEFEALAELIEILRDQFTSTDLEMLGRRYEAFCGNFTRRYVRGEFGIEDPDEIRSDVSKMSVIGKVLSVEISPFEERINEIADDKEEAQGNREWEADDRESENVEERCSDGELDSMFDTLR